MSTDKTVQFTNVSAHIRQPYLVTIPDLCHRMTVARESCEEVTLAAAACGYLSTVGVAHGVHVVGPDSAPSTAMVSVVCTDHTTVDLEWDPMVSEWVVSVENDDDLTDEGIADGLRQILDGLVEDAAERLGSPDECPVIAEQARVLRAAIARISGL